MEKLVFAAVFLPILAAPVAYMNDEENRHFGDVFTSSVALSELAITLLLLQSGATAALPGFCGEGLTFAEGGFKSVLMVLCALVFALSALASPSYFHGEPRVGRYHAFLLLTLGAIEGVFLSADLFTTYVFFEMMSLASWVWVAQNETEQSEKAANTYLAIAIIGGLVMLYGLFSLRGLLGTLSFAELPAAAQAVREDPRFFAAGLCLLTGFGAKAGMYPLHIWLPKAHPVAPAPASALLSGILTKSGIFGVLLCATLLYTGDARFFWIVLALGVITMVLGALLALFSVDLKRVLACSSLSQIGFILVGAAILSTGEETSYAAAGALLHVVNHALIKLVLFVSAGVLYHNYHTLDLNELRGAGRGSKTLAACFLTGALAIGGVPLFGGYISKTLLHEAIVEHIHLAAGLQAELLHAVEVLFLFSGGLTIAYMSKLFVRLFIQKSRTERERLQMDGSTALAICVPAAALLLMGIFPHYTYEPMANYAAASLGAEKIHVAFFSMTNLRGAAISIAVGLVVYGVIVRWLLTRQRDGAYTLSHLPFNLEEHVYRPLLGLLTFAGAFAARLVYSLTDWTLQLINACMMFGASDRIEPRRDNHFTLYSQKYVRPGRISQTLAFELLLFGVGVVLTLFYLLLV